MKAELDEIATNVADVINEHINNSIAWAVDGTAVDELSDDYFNEAITDIRQLVIKKLKEY
jgi:flagellar basal body P-ring protein FlgI|tara:strand:- start:2588 stop:2767 length:180 start_codon:yes stop_codon:yes gene_type:complete